MEETPRQLGRYELIRRIAAGGMGEIYLARSTGTGGFEKTVIIKTILPHLAEEEEFVDKFLDEGRIVVNLAHGNIVPVFDMDEIDGEYFIAMEYVPGRDLRDVLEALREKGETMPPELAAYIVSEVCEGLGYAHRQTDEEGESLEIVHRDVSPSNVLLSTEGEVKIIDFGIARAADRRAKSLSGRIQGKCCYMSPEQARGGSLDHRSDIFSTGVVLYEMLTGARPFEGDSDLKSLELVRECEYDPPSLLDGRVPEELDAIVERALAEEPEERYQKIDQMGVDLMEFLVERGRAVTSGEVAEFLDELFPEGPERDAFREMREKAPDSDMDLDEALNYQLEKLSQGGQDPEVGGLETTLPDSDEERPAAPRDGGGRTATLTPETGVDSEADSAGGEGGSGPESPAAAGTPQRASDGSVRSRPTTPASTSPAGEPSGGSTGRLLAVAVGLVVLAGGAVVWTMTSARQGSLRVQSDPSGAAITVDGTEVAGSRTPHELTVEPGDHVVEVHKEGFEPRQLRVDVAEGERETFSIALQEREEEQKKEPKTFRLTSEPPGAEIAVNQTPVGAAPQSIRVAPGETKFVEATKQGCKDGRMAVFYGRDSETVTVHLDCRDSSGGDDEKKAGPKAASAQAGGGSSGGARRPVRRPRRVELTVETDPAGATLRVDGEKLGETPHTREFPRSETIEVELAKSGHQTVTRSLEPGEVDGGRLSVELPKKETGCLDFFAVHPQYNEIAIDGSWLEGRHQKLQGYELPVGDHEIRVRNPDAGRDETFSFEVEPGEECTSLTVWDPDDG